MGYGRYTSEPEKIDPFRDNWWCSASARNAPPPQPHVNGAPFLPAADREEAAAEWRKLQSVSAAPNWLAAQTLAFAREHPRDPRVREALALAVRATRFGCTDQQTGGFSRRAFDLLHRRYPDTQWARKTPYWFQ
jgi:hypothetical protein